MKTCIKCLIPKPLSEFYKHPNKKDGLSPQCKECHKKDCMERYHDKLKNNPSYKKARADYSHHWHIKNKARNNTRIANTEKGKRKRCLEHYGGKCVCCGENRYEFLAMDHMNGGGRRHRDEIGAKIHRWLIRENFPDGFRVLCHNCNQSIGLYGYCPHQKSDLG